MAQPKIAQPSSLRRQNRFLVMLLVGAAIISATKELDRLRNLTSGLVSIAASLHERVNAGAQAPADPGCPEALADNDRSGQPYNWNGRVAPERLTAASGNDAAPAAGGGLVASSAVSCSEPATILVQVSPPVIEVASRAQHPREFSSARHSGATQGSLSPIQSAAVRGHNNNVRLHLNVSVPVAGELFTPLVNEEVQDISFAAKRRTLKVCPLGTTAVSALAESRPLDFPARQARARAMARILGRGISVGPADPDHPEVIAFKTRDGLVTLDLLQLLRATASADDLNAEAISADAPRKLRNLIQWTTLTEPAAAEDTH